MHVHRSRSVDCVIQYASIRGPLKIQQGLFVDESMKYGGRRTFKVMCQLMTASCRRKYSHAHVEAGTLRLSYRSRMWFP